LPFRGRGGGGAGTGHLLDSRVDEAAAKGTRVRFAVGSVVYPILVGLSFLSAAVTLALHGLLAVYYAFNQLRVPLKPGAQEQPESAPTPGDPRTPVMAEGPVGEDGAL